MPIHYLRFPELTVKQRDRLFSNYANDTGVFLLDSGNSDHQNAVYDIVAVKPLQIFTSRGNQSAAKLKALQQQQTLNLQDIPDELSYLPCLGGLFFALSYDLGRCYEKIPDQALDDLELADFFAAIFGCILIIDHNKHCSFLICTDDNCKLIYEQLSVEINRILDDISDKELIAFKLLTNWSSNFSEAQYIKAFDQVQSYIQAGDCYQINLAQRFMAKCCGSSWHAYCRLSEANKAPFSAFINTGEADILSLSPERFIRLNNNQVETRPIKGTRPRGESLEQDQRLINELLRSEKDQAENLMIVDLMRNDLGRSCKPGTIEVPELFNLESFHSVHHLVSTIRGQLAEHESAYTLLANCFPGGSITGTPKIKAMNIIDQLEPHRRSYYCGSTGYIDSRGNMDCNINIRTLVRKNDLIYCWAGGGLVSDSNQQDEYQETFDKLSRILPILGGSNFMSELGK